MTELAFARLLAWALVVGAILGCACIVWRARKRENELGDNARLGRSVRDIMRERGEQ